ncbi:MAG: hypothetical protein RBT22_11480 [Aliarcobacter sp.]|nr:hypothetical protein [Aliarcobacter sp.]
MGYTLILDKDYFIPYLNDKLSLSRNAQGLPKYRFEYKTECIIDILINIQKDKIDLLKLFESNHSKALDLTENYNIIVMNYNLEMDLICSDKSVEKYCEIFNVINPDNNRKYLLEQRHQQIKKIEHILTVLESIENNNLPNSYKRIRKLLIKISKKG